MSLDTKTLKDEAQRLIDIQSADPRMGALYRHEYLKVATPEAVLALIAENDELRNVGSQLRAFFVDATEQCCKAERERDQLRAEVAGLKTGYEAYERVNAELKAENEALCEKLPNLNVSGFADAFYTVAEKLGITGARPVSPMQVFASEVLPALQSAIRDAERYRWIRDKSEAVHQFYLSVPLWFTGVRFRAEDVDKAIDAMSKGEQS